MKNIEFGFHILHMSSWEGILYQANAILTSKWKYIDCIAEVTIWKFDFNENRICYIYQFRYKEFTNLSYFALYNYIMYFILLRKNNNIWYIDFYCFDTYESVLIWMDHCWILLISFVWFSYWKKRSKVDVKRAPKAPRNARHEGEGLKTY